MIPNEMEKHQAMLLTMILWSELRDECAAAHKQWSPEYWAAITERVRSNPHFAPYDLTITSYEDIVDFADKLREERRALEVKLAGYPHQVASAWRLNKL